MHRKVDARTAIAADDARIRAGHALKLRVVHHKYATQITAHARAVKRASSFGSKPRLGRGHHDCWPRLRRAPRCRLRGDAIVTLAARFLAQASRMWSIWPAAWPIAPATLPRAHYLLNSCLNHDNKVEIKQVSAWLTGLKGCQTFHA
jgi:hypothetical protein